MWTDVNNESAKLSKFLRISPYFLSNIIWRGTFSASNLGLTRFRNSMTSSLTTCSCVKGHCCARSQLVFKWFQIWQSKEDTGTEERLERYAILPVLILKPKYGQPPAHQLWRCGKAAPRFRMRGPCWASTSQQCGEPLKMMVWYDMIWYDMIWYDMIWYDMIWYDMIWYDMICVWIWCISPM